MTVWLNQHFLSLSMVGARLKRQWLNTLMICAVIGITVTLPGLMFVGIQHLQHADNPLKHQAQISVFLTANLPANALQRLINDCQQLPQVAEVRYVSKEEALKQLNAQFAPTPLISDTANNPLPDALYLTLADSDPGAISPISQALQGRPEVDELVMDSAWMQQLHDSVAFLRRLVILFTSLLGIAMVTVISNTVRMQVLTHQAEIEVSRLIGATHSYIRRPFLYMGSAYGLGGGLIAFVCMGVLVRTLQTPLQQVLHHLPNTFHQPLPWLSVAFGVLLVSTAIGWLAALIALFQRPTTTQ